MKSHVHGDTVNKPLLLLLLFLFFWSFQLLLFQQTGQAKVYLSILYWWWKPLHVNLNGSLKCFSKTLRTLTLFHQEVIKLTALIPEINFDIMSEEWLLKNKYINLKTCKVYKRDFCHRKKTVHMILHAWYNHYFPLHWAWKNKQPSTRDNIILPTWSYLNHATAPLLN